MADEEKDDVTEDETDSKDSASVPNPSQPDQETPEAAAAEAPTAEEEAPAAEEPAAEEPVAEEPAAAAEEPASAPAPAAEPEEELSSKERRRGARSLHSGQAAPQRTVEERAELRATERRSKAERRRAWRQGRREKRRAAGTREDTTPAPVDTSGASKARVRQGVVVSEKADKTITVRIDVQRQHRTYGKIVRSSSTLHAHDEANDANAGDTVRVVESRPLSRTKRWRLVEVLERAR